MFSSSTFHIIIFTFQNTVDSRSNVFQGSDLNLPLEPKNAVAIPWLSRKNKAGKANNAEWIWDIGYRICSADRILALICWDGQGAMDRQTDGQTNRWTDGWIWHLIEMRRRSKLSKKAKWMALRIQWSNLKRTSRFSACFESQFFSQTVRSSYTSQQGRIHNNRFGSREFFHILFQIW